MMKKMMNSMIGNMTVEEKERMMLVMMPEMMKRIDVKVLVPNMLETLGKMISLFGIYDLLKTAANSEELKASIANKIQEIKENNPDLLQNMFGMMMPMMAGMMPKMMSVMMPMMEKMMPMCAGEDGMMSSCSPEMQEQMAVCMQTMIPHCISMVLSTKKVEEKQGFALNIIDIISNGATTELDTEAKTDFQTKAFEGITQAISNTN